MDLDAMNHGDIMKLDEVAEMLRCSTRHLQTIRKKDGFPKAVVIGDSVVRYIRADIESFLRNGGFAVRTK
jgi:predicted DNA-binding transcriptional regulator AlpA